MKCDDCQKGNFSLCKHYSFIGSRQQGSNADYVVVPEQNAVPFDKTVPVSYTHLENGETLHITQDAEMADGSHWGVTTVDGTEGWVDLEKTEEWKAEHLDTVEESVDAVAEVSVTPAEVAKATETPAPTETAEATETPTPTITEEADEAENTEKDSKEPEAENTDTKDSREASGQNVRCV